MVSYMDIEMMRYRKMRNALKYILPILMAAVLAISIPAQTYASGEIDDGYEEEYDGEPEADDYDDSDYYEEDEYYEDDADGGYYEEIVEEESTTTPAQAAEEAVQTVQTDENGWPIAPEVMSGSVMMVEVNTGAVLYSKDVDTQRYPASTTKILTCLIALENCSLTEIVTYSANAVDLEDGDSSIDAVEGEEMTMKDCLYGLMLPSGNDCAIAIAEHVAGSVEAFCELMNQRAAELGCTNSHFVNPNGLYNKDHYTTASDLCKIAQAAFNNSAFVEIVSHATYTIPETNMSEARLIENTNYMIDPTSSYYYENVVGGKTGYLYESGRCLVTLAKKNGLTIVTVCLFCSNYTGVFIDTEELLDYAFNGFALSNISESESRFSYACTDARIRLDSTAQILMPKNLTLDELTSEIDFTYDMDQDEFYERSAEAGITSQDGRHLYAIINYSYAGNYLGAINVILDDNMEIAEASFASIKYISPWWFILSIVVFLGLTILFYGLIRKTPERRRRKTKVIQTQTPDGKPIPINVIKVREEMQMTQTTSGRNGTVRVRQVQPSETKNRRSKK